MKNEDWFHRHVAPSKPTVAILSQSERTWQINAALATTDIDYAIDPTDPYQYDIIVIETPDRRMFKEVLKRPLHDTTVLFRMRGDPYWGIHHWYDGPLPVRKAKQYLALKQLDWVDGCLAIAPHQARKYMHHTGNPTRQVTLSRDVDNWPTASHASEKLRILSLTNCMYPQKTRPIIEYAPAVESVLQDSGGYWHIGGKGRYADELAEGLADYDHIQFEGYVDAKERLADANLMLHLSYFDSFAGAILEGMASTLPVITTDHPAFTENDLPVETIDGSANQLKTLLRRYTDPGRRQPIGDRNESHIAERYSHERLGERWRHVLCWFHHQL